ncbi:MAG: bacillithiol biosynthesis cysteine-adding enzyme BshC [Ignavibacteriae bacterium]|nr:bacillithiol biosynthesis cysteine-adding enzyme BshC [Ignavibacteriota bacterium]
MQVDFSQIPGMSELYIDYVNDFEKVKNFYEINFRDENFYEKIFNNIKNRNGNEIVEIIKKQYNNFSASEKTKSNIELLKKENTIAVFTGQQLGLFGGPLYTIYKIFTAIKLSEYLNEKFKDHNFIPIFWMAGDDHDFEEIANLKLLNNENEIETILYNDKILNEENNGSVGSLKFSDSINDFNNRIINSLRQTEFIKEVIDFSKEVFDRNLTIAESFFKFIHKIFDETGLVIFNPQDKEVKKLLIPIFRKELTDYKIHTKDILLRSVELDENYHSQVKVKPINLFFSDETGRHLIEPIEDEFRLKGKRKRITSTEIFNLLEEKPECFSPNVLLRPICEDYLFPTGFYVAGPGEINYYAQAIPLYKHFNLQHPFIFPRASATILESNIAKILMKYNVSTAQFFGDFQKLIDEILNNISDNSIEKMFTDASENIQNILNNLSNSLETIDKTLSDSSKNASEKIIHQLEILKSKSLKSQEVKFEATIRQLKKAKNNIYPNDNLQERELGIINFINKYGFDFFDWLYNELDIHEFKHQILEL